MDYETLAARVAACADQAAGKEVADLTEEERFAIAFLAGCETEMRADGGSFPLAIKGVICITKIDGKFHVAQNARL